MSCWDIDATTAAAAVARSRSPRRARDQQPAGRHYAEGRRRRAAAAATAPEAPLTMSSSPKCRVTRPPCRADSAAAAAAQRPRRRALQPRAHPCRRRRRRCCAAALGALVCAVASLLCGCRAVVAAAAGAPRVVRCGGGGGGVDTGGGATDEASDLPTPVSWADDLSDASLRAWHASLSLQPLRLCLQHALLQVTACYADGRFELRRMADQLLPAVVEVALWAEAAVLEQLWVSFLPLADTLPCWLAAASLQLTLERAHTLGHSLPRPRSCGARVGGAATVTAALERATSDRHRLVCARLIGTLLRRPTHSCNAGGGGGGGGAATALLNACVRASVRRTRI